MKSFQTNFLYVFITGCSLTTVVLQLLALGVQNPLHFDYMDKPPSEVIKAMC